MSKKLYVWDRLVRILHWSLVTTFTISYLSSGEIRTLHVYSGYTLLGIISIRIIWGFIGSHYARFRSFVFSPAAVVDYFRGFVGEGSGRTYVGHNPAGSWMVVTLLVCLLATGFTGLMTYGTKGYGPFATLDAESGLTTQAQQSLPVPAAPQAEHDHDDEEHSAWQDVHELIANLTLVLVFLHITGVIASSRKDRENLVSAMIHGYKKS